MSISRFRKYQNLKSNLINVNFDTIDLFQLQNNKKRKKILREKLGKIESELIDIDFNCILADYRPAKKFTSIPIEFYFKEIASIDKQLYYLEISGTRECKNFLDRVEHRITQLQKKIKKTQHYILKEVI